MHKLIGFFIVGLLAHQTLPAQTHPPVEQSIFWEVTGKELKQPSYLFGTFHLLDSRFLDTLNVVKDKFNTSKTVVGEMLFDSTLTVKVMTASMLTGTTLDKLLSAEDYEKTSVWLKELMGYDLKMFNQLNPITIQILLMTGVQQKYYPLNLTDNVLIDVYFQQQAKQTQRKLIGLETPEEQIHVLYGQFSYERQAALLSHYVQTREKAQEEMEALNSSYRNQELTKLEAMLSSYQYEKKETEALLDNRNKKWMNVLPDLMKEQSTFVAIGALHLAGENGLVSLLRKSGYTVKPLKMK
jgi:uncharacterized protein YbaP (TraB family)